MDPRIRRLIQAAWAESADDRPTAAQVAEFLKKVAKGESSPDLPHGGPAIRYISDNAEQRRRCGDFEHAGQQLLHFKPDLRDPGRHLAQRLHGWLVQHRFSAHRQCLPGR